MDKRAAILIPCLLTGGTEVSTFETGRTLKNQGYDVDIVVYFNEVDRLMQETFNQAGLNVVLLSCDRSARQISLAAKLLKIFFQGRYSLVWVQYMTPSLLPVLVARLFTKNLIAAVHVAAGHYSASGLKRIRWLAKYWTNLFVCVSQTSAKGIFGADFFDSKGQGSVAVMPNMLDFEHAQCSKPLDWRAVFNIPSEFFVVGYLGRLSVNKGIDLLIEQAISSVRAGSKFCFVICGEGQVKADLIARVSAEGMQNRIFFAGAVLRKNVFSALKGFDVAVVPSREEGFGISAIETMAAGVPLVASRVDALAEIVEDHTTGLLFDLEQPKEMMEAVSKFIDNPDFSREVSQSAMLSVSMNFSREVVSQRLISSIEG